MRYTVRWAPLALAGAIAVPAAAQLCPVERCIRGGGGPLRVECLLQWTGIPADVVACADGTACDLDGMADGVCRFAVAPCVDVGGCVAEPMPPLEAARVRPRRAPAAETLEAAVQSTITGVPGAPRCSSTVAVDVPLREDGRRLGKLRLRITGRARGVRDRDRLTFLCWPAGTRPTFDEDVAPIFATRCAPTCHEAGGRISSVDLTRTAAHRTLVPSRVEPRRVRRSRLVTTLRRRMPPGCHRPLPPEWAPGGCPTPDEIDTVRAWIALGAPNN